MSVTTWSPMRELESLRERMDKLFTDFAPVPRAMFEPGFVPLDVQETDHDVVVTASMPRIKPDDMEVDITKGVLTIRGESKEEREEKDATWHVKERRMGKVYRSITLPSPVYDDEAKAAFENGVLTVTIPKAEPTPKRRIEVEAR